MKPVSTRNAGVFEFLRDSVSIQEVVGAEEDEKIYCINPDHEDVDPPDMHVYDDHVHCFVCGFHADVTKAWQAIRDLSSPWEAAQDLAREFSLELPEIDPAAQARYEARRQKEESHAKVAQERHERLMSERGKAVREYLEGRGFDEELQGRFLLGATLEGNVNIPFFSEGRVHGQVVRRLDGSEPKYRAPKKEDFPLGRRPLFMPGGSPKATEYLLVEGYLDAVAAEALGIPGIGIGAAHPSKEQLRDLRVLGDRGASFVIIPDKDDSGDEAADKSVKALYPYARIAEHVPEGKDVADLFKADRARGKEVIEALMSDARDALEIALEGIAKTGGRRKALYLKEEIVPLILQLPEESERQVVIADVAKATQLSKDVLLRARAAVEAGQISAEPEDADDLPESEWADLLEPGVLNRYVEDAARVKGAVGDLGPVKVIKLSEAGSQLDLYPNGKPIGTSSMLTGPASVGKNFAVDVAVSMSPTEFYLPFEVASSQVFYYAAKLNPEFLKHKFLYPNEVEAVDTVIEFLRPMLTKGEARKLVTNKDSAGAFTFDDIEVEGPITGIVPTVRNKLEDQFETRLLTVELIKAPNQISEQSRALSEQFLPEAWEPANEYLKLRWQSALRSLTGVRNVTADFMRDERFRFTNEDIEHGVRLWGNFMGLMSAHAWLEQRNRDIRQMPNGKLAVVATPADYEAVYNLFRDVAYRSVTQIGKVHTKILQAVHDLKEDSRFPEDGFSHREIAKKAGVSPGTVSKNRAFLVKSAGLLYETQSGKLAMSDSVTPENWTDQAPMKGFPTPEDVRRFAEASTPSPSSQEPRNHAADFGPKLHRNGQKGDSDAQESPGITGITPDEEPWAELAPAAEVELADDEELFC